MVAARFCFVRVLVQLFFTFFFYFPFGVMSQELAAALDVTEDQLARLLTWADGADSTDRTLMGGVTLGEMAQ